MPAFTLSLTLPRRGGGDWHIGLLLWLLALLLLLLPTMALAADPVLRLDHAEFILSDAAEPPPDSAPWQPQTLPDNWRATRPDASGYAWYRLRFDLPKRPDELQAIYMPWLRTVGAVYLNGTHVGQDGPFEKAAPGARPQLFDVRPELLHTGANTLHVRLWVEKGRRGAVSIISLGDRTELQGEFDREVFLRVSGLQFTGLLSALLGIYVLFLWSRRPRESIYAYFGWAAVLKGALIAIDLGYTQLSGPLGGILRATIVWLIWATLFLYCLRFAGWRWPRVEQGVWLWAGVSIVVWSIPDFYPGFWLVDYWRYTPEVAACAISLLMAYIVWRIRTIESALLFVGHVLSTAGLIYGDMWENITGTLESIDFGLYHLVPLFLIMGWILANRFAKSLNESEKLNAELEQRVEQKHAELEANYQRLNSLEQQQAVVEERQRIMSDMHDGIGGQLISALSLVEQGESSSTEVATALRECIDDLRLTIDSLEPTENDLLPVLGNFRYRLEGRLKKQGIDLDWQVKEVPKLACLTPQNVLQVLRIMQEAFTNVLKHAHASRISVETGVDGGNRVRDNGNGFAGDHKGHGLDNMKRRARTVGGDLDIQPSPTGTTLSLLLPVT